MQPFVWYLTLICRLQDEQHASRWLISRQQIRLPAVTTVLFITYVSLHNPPGETCSVDDFFVVIGMTGTSETSAFDETSPSGKDYLAEVSLHL